MPIFTKSGKRQVLELPIYAISPNPHQPRQTFSSEELAELAASVSQFGILHPISVRKNSTGWELIAGERRLRAAELAGLPTVPCLVMDINEQDSSLLALIENLQRSDLDVWEEAIAMRTLIDRYQFSQEELGKKVGISQSAVANKLRLLKLPEPVIRAARQAGLSERHARALLRLPNEALQKKAISHIIQNRLSVAKTEAYVDRLCTKPDRPKKAIPIYRTKDVRLFLNTVHRSLSIMQSAGVSASIGRQENDHELTLTIHISKPECSNST